MKKNNSVWALILLIITGCTKKSPDLIISKWEKNTEFEAVIERTLASAPKGQCLQDIFTVDTLKKEIKGLEKNFSQGQKVKGSWKHLKLETLSIPEANFLKTYGDQIGDLQNKDRFDYSSCESVPCIFNKIYGKDEGIAGYVHYLWYLKFGNMLSADNQIPNQVSKKPGIYASKDIPFENYLLNDEELFAFWRLSLMLSEPHTTLNYLKEVQRIPRGGEFELPKLLGACGLASSTGWVILTDQCLKLESDIPDGGYFYHAVTHELSHQVDYEQGRGTRTNYRSQKKDYLDVSGMFIKEFVDDKGVMQRQWELRPEAKIISKYAGTSPAENFAESIAILRHEGDEALKNVSDEHFKFVSENYYQDRSFTTEIFIKDWVTKYTPVTDKEVLKAVMDCNEDPTSPKSKFFKSADFAAPVFPGMLNCLGSKADEIGKSIKAKISVAEPDGCRVISNADEVWDNQLKAKIKSTFHRYLEESEKDKESLDRIKKFYYQISDKTLGRKVYLECYGDKEEESCFISKMKEHIFDTALSLEISPENAQEMAASYFSSEAYQKNKLKIKKDYQAFVVSNLEAIRVKSKELWKACHSLPQNDDLPPSGNSFLLSDGYLISSIYNCLNTKIPEASNEIVTKFSLDGIYVRHDREGETLADEIKPHMIKMLQGYYLEEKQKEFASYVPVLEKLTVGLIDMLRPHVERLKKGKSPSELMATCMSDGVKAIVVKPRYHLKSELVSDFVEKKVCSKLIP
jgi:hypothetical protein